MISIDSLDLDILNILNKLDVNSHIMTSDMVKKLFDNVNTIYEFKKYDNLIRSRLTKLSKYGLIEINPQGIKYLLLKDKVHLLELQCKDPIIKQKSYFLKIENKWYVFPFPF